MDNFVDESYLGNHILGISNTSMGDINASEIITVDISETETEDIKYYPMCTLESVVGEYIDDSPYIYQMYGRDFEVTPDTEVYITIGFNPRTRKPLLEKVLYYHCAKYSEIRKSDEQEVTISLDREHPETSEIPAETFKFNGERYQLSKLRIRGSKPEDEIDDYVRNMYDSQNRLVRLRDVLIEDRVFTITFNFINWNVPINTPIEDIFKEIFEDDGTPLDCTYISYITDEQTIRFILDRGTTFTFEMNPDCQDIPNRYESFTCFINGIEIEDEEFLFDSDYEFDNIIDDLTFDIVAKVIERRVISISSQGDLEVIDASTNEYVLNYYDIVTTYLTSYDHLDSATFYVSLKDSRAYDGILYLRTYYDKDGRRLAYSDSAEQYISGDFCTIQMTYIRESETETTDTSAGSTPGFIPIRPRPRPMSNIDWFSGSLFLRPKEKYIPRKVRFVVMSNINVFIGFAPAGTEDLELMQIHMQDMNFSPSEKINYEYPDDSACELETEDDIVYIKCSWTPFADDPTIIKKWSYTLGNRKTNTNNAQNNETLETNPSRDVTIYIDTQKIDVVNVLIDKMPDTIKVFENYFNEYIEGYSYTTKADNYYNNKTSLTITETGPNDVISYSMQRMAYSDDSPVGPPYTDSREAKSITYTNTNMFVNGDFYYIMTIRSMKKYIPKTVNIYFLDDDMLSVSNLNVIIDNPETSDTTMTSNGTEGSGIIQDLGMFYSLWKYKMTSGFDFRFKIVLLPEISQKISSIEYFMRGYKGNWQEHVQTDTYGVPNEEEGVFEISMEADTFEYFYEYNEIDVFVRPSVIPVYTYSISSEDNHVNVAVWGNDWDDPNDTTTVITENQSGNPYVTLTTSYKHNNQYKLKLWCTNELYLNYSYILSDVDGGYTKIIGTGSGKFPENSEPIEYISPEGFFEEYGNGTLIQFGALPETILYMREACEEEPKKWLMIPPRANGSRDVFIRIT